MLRSSSWSSRPSSRSQRRAGLAQAALEVLEDRRLLSVTVVSTQNGSTALGNGVSREPSVSADGRFVVFSSTASNLVANDTNNATDVFVHDRMTGATERVSVSSGGDEGNGPSGETLGADSGISDGGRFIGFQSSASNLVPGDT